MLEPVHDLAFKTNFSNFEAKKVKFDKLNRDSERKITLFWSKIWKILVEMEIVDRLLGSTIE